MDFNKVLLLVKSNSHLTESGLNLILDIKSGVNRVRSNMIPYDTNLSKGEPGPIGKSGPFVQKRRFHDRVKASKRIGSHNLDIFSVIIGSLLGNDGQMNKLVEGSRLNFRTSNEKYAQWMYTFFFTRGYCSNLEPRMYTRKLKHNGVEMEHERFEFNTFTFRSFN